MKDLKFACRQLLKNPGFTAAAVLTLALGIAVNVAVFSLVNPVLLRPFPAADPERLVSVAVFDREHGRPERGAFSLPDLLEFEQRSGSFAGLFGMFSDGLVLTGRDGADRIQGTIVSPNFLEVLGVPPRLGRAFQADDADPGRGAVMLISHALWQQRFAAQPQLDSIQARVDGRPVTVVGVMPPGFRFPHESEIWMPLLRNPAAARGSRYLKVIGRVRDGVDLGHAGAEARSIAEALAREYPQTNRDLTAAVFPLRNLLTPGPIRLMLLMLQAAVGCVLCIACANVAGLILARGWGRRKEFAVRSALGASRADQCRLLLAEGLLLGVAAGFLGILLSRLGLDAILALIPVSIPYWIEFGLDTRIAIFAAALAVGSGLIASLMPGLEALRADPAAALKGHGAGIAGGPAPRRFRQGLVIAQVAVSFALLVGASLMIQSFLATQHAALGFQPGQRFVFQMVLPKAGYATQEDRVRAAERVLERFRSRAEIRAIGALHPTVPLGDFLSSSMYVRVGRDDAEAQSAGNLHVVGEALQALGIPLLRGRLFDPATIASGRSVCLINETMANRFFPQQDPIGQGIKFRGSPDEDSMEIIGVVTDIRRASIHEKPENQVYRPFAQIGQGGTFAIVGHARTDPNRLAAAARAEVNAVDPNIAVHDARALEDFVAVSESYWMARMNAWLFSVLGVSALVLSLTGLYGVVAFTAGQRTQEFGVRLALGATRQQLAALVLAHAARLGLAGLAAGVLLAFGATRLLGGLLFGVAPTQPASFGVALLLFAVSVLIACWLPARRAARVDPLQALRNE